MPFEDEQLSVQDDDILRNLMNTRGPIPDRKGYKFVSVGIDWGNIHYIVIHGLKGDGQIDLLNAIPIQKPYATDSSAIGKDIQQIRVALAPYKPDIIVADIGDSGDKIAQLIKIYGEDKVFGCRYNSSPRSTGQIIPTWSEANNTVTVDKLMQNKKYITYIKENGIRFFGNENHRDTQSFIQHWKNVVIREEEDLTTGEFYQIITRKGEDHYSQSATYSMIGWERLQDLYSSGKGYAFDATFVDGDNDLQAPDIYTDFFD